MGKQAAVNIVGHFAVRVSLVAVVAVTTIICANAQTAAPSSSGTAGGAATSRGSIYHRVVLSEEDTAEPQKHRKYTGRVLWWVETMTGANGAKDQAVRADIDIPDGKLQAQLTIWRNQNSGLPASHVIEIKFDPRPGFAGGGIMSMPGMLMKSNEDARGPALAGLSVEAGTNVFLLGLSNTEADRKTNLQLLNGQPWFDVPLRYTDKRPAILAVEKGTAGDLAFAAAFKSWGETLPETPRQ